MHALRLAKCLYLLMAIAAIKKGRLLLPPAEFLYARGNSLVAPPLVSEVSEEHEREDLKE